MKIYVIILSLLIVSPKFLLAQNNSVNPNPYSNEAFIKAVDLYKNAIGRNSKIFTGIFYNDSHLGIIGDPFFMKDAWEISTIVYEGQPYDSIYIKYDIYKDIVIVKYVDKRSYVIPLEVDKAKVDEFSVMGHHFIRIEFDSLSTIKTGFFDLLYDGETATVLAKRQKEILITNELNRLAKEFSLKEKHYINLGNNFHEIKGKKSILDVLSDRKNEVKAFLKKNKTRLKNDHEKQLIEAVKYYDSIVTNPAL